MVVPPRGRVTVWVTRESGFESTSEAWWYLLQNAQQVAERHGRKSHELVLSTYLPTFPLSQFTSHAITLRPVTSETTVQDFTINDHSPPHLPHPNRGFQSQRSNPHFPVHHSMAQPSHIPGFCHPHFGAQPDIPKVLYLFTSSTMFDFATNDSKEGEQETKESFVPYWTDDPMGKPRPREMRSTSWSYGGNSGW